MTSQKTIAFNPKLLVGLGGIFNTFRLGAAGLKQYIVGDRVSLLNSKTHECLGRAVVVDVIYGDKFVMAEHHAHQNHVILGRGIESEASAYLLKALKNAYGGMIYNRCHDCTVIYLKVIDEHGEVDT
jgi:hypothetical protein